MTEPESLKGLKVLVTRPEGQGEKLHKAIERAGGQAELFPVISIEPVSNPQRQAGIRQRIQDLDHYQILVFISSNAVRYGMEWIDKAWPQFPLGVEVVAVGPATAAALCGLPCTVHTSSAGMLSEDILRLPVLTHVDGKKVALFRGEGGRELLAETLRSRGAQVDYIETYRRRAVARSGIELDELLKSKQINVVTATSGQILDSLCQLVDSSNHNIYRIPLLVPSDRLVEKARQAGFEQVSCSSGATDDAIIAGLVKLAGPLQS